MAPRGPRPTPRLAALLAVSATLVAGVFFVQSHVLFMHQASSAIVLDSDRHALDRPPTAQLPPNQRSPKELPGEVWAGHPLPSLAAQAAAVRDLLSTDEQKELEALCGRCLLHQLKLFVGHGNAQKVFVATGDIPDMWIRDGALQLGALIPRMSSQPFLRLLVEGAVRTQAFSILADPYANAYSPKWRDPAELTLGERNLGRGGWVATRNYELDSGAYFLQLLWNVYATPGYDRTQLLREPVVFEAASVLVDVWTIEQHHEEKSVYRYAELPRNGLGPPCNYTGMSWSGFRPSDDQQVHCYNVPVNMYAAAALERALELNAHIWRSESFEQRATKLLEGIQQGIQRFGIVEVEPGVKVYAYEVDGLGNRLVDADDANVPSLLSIPLLGYRYDTEIYRTTRARILSNKNPMYFEGEHLQGIGSYHTRPGQVWPLALIVQALTAETAQERGQMLRLLLKTQCGNGLMHESVNANDLNACSRAWFGWANAMLVALVESGLGWDCSGAAEQQHHAAATKGGAQDALYFGSLFAGVTFDAELKVPEYVGA